eukprot:jgi/Galph1/5644/GphlegSOOS_G4269.1
MRGTLFFLPNFSSITLQPKFCLWPKKIGSRGLHVFCCQDYLHWLTARGAEIDRRRNQWISQRQQQRKTVSKEEWELLIWKFEQEAKEMGQSDFFESDNGDSSEVEGYSIRDIDESLLGQSDTTILAKIFPIAETGLCAAAVRTILFVSRISLWRDLFTVAGPIPVLYATLRWGPRYGRLALYLIFCAFLIRPGPLFCLQYMLTQGILALVLSHVMWWQWHWSLCIVASAIAYAIGIAIEVSLTCFIFERNTWELITTQAVQLFSKLLPVSLNSAVYKETLKSHPSLTIWVRVAIVIFLLLHSILHTISIYIPSTLVLASISMQLRLLQKEPSLLPGFQQLLSQMKEAQDED